MTNNMTI